MPCKTARRRGKRRWMSSSIDAIHTRMPHRRVLPKLHKPGSLHISTSHILKPDKPLLHLHYESLPILAEEPPLVIRPEDKTYIPTTSPTECAPSHDAASSNEPTSEILQAGEEVPRPSSPSPPQSLIIDTTADQYDTLDDDEARRAILAQKLQEVFNLPSAETVLAEYPSWLFRSILLQGFLYLTERHLCFYAYIKGKEGQVIRSGSMYRRFPKSILQSKYWFILKDDVLSWYSSSTNPYFPVDHIPLHYVTNIEPSPTHPERFKIITPNKIYRFAAESAKSQQEWIKTLRKVAFRSQSVDDSVKVRITILKSSV